MLVAAAALAEIRATTRDPAGAGDGAASDADRPRPFARLGRFRLGEARS